MRTNFLMVPTNALLSASFCYLLILLLSSTSGAITQAESHQKYYSKNQEVQDKHSDTNKLISAIRTRETKQIISLPPTNSQQLFSEQNNTRQNDVHPSTSTARNNFNNIRRREAQEVNNERRPALDSILYYTPRDDSYNSLEAEEHDPSAGRRRFVRDLSESSGGCDSSSSSSQPAVFGLRCDEGAEVSDGVLVIKANEPTDIILIGRNLDSNISIALTTEENSAQADCTHADRVKTLSFRNISSNLGQVSIDITAPALQRPYYLCLRDARGRWFHQGSEAWLKLIVKEDLLPLYMKLFVIACLLMLSGLFSGLNLGLMALDKNELQVIISCGTDTEKRYARAIEPVRRRGNYLLCSILFSNVLVNSTIAVLLEELTSGIVAVMTSTIFIVMFGEILPQAFCSRHGLAVGAKTVSITYFCMIVTFPLSYPVSSCLDWILGEEIGHAYDRERLMEFIRVTRDYNNLETDEVNIISGALKLKRIPLSEVMTRIEDVFMLDVNSCLDFDTIQAIIERGYSRVPVHEAANKKNIVALLFAKDLALLDPDDKTPVQTMISFYNHPLMYLFEDTTLDLALNEFKTGKSHMAFVRRVLDDGDRDPVYEITGIVTLEDVIEEIMQMEINDETDTLSDNRRKRRRKEAQVRGDFSEFTKIGAGDLSSSIVTPQLCLAAYQYLATTVGPFSPKYISDSKLKRLLSQRIYFKVRLDDQLSARRLYTAGVPVDHFIMILEGRVHVICGKESLVFEGGPFSFFGTAALTAPSAGAARSDDSPVLTATPTANSHHQVATAATRKESTATNKSGTTTSIGGGGGGGQSLVLVERRDSLLANSWTVDGQLSIPMKKLEHSGASETTETGAGGSSLTQTQTQTPVSAMRASESRVSLPSLAAGCQADKSIVPAPTCHIIPDYTVEVVANTSYLKISRGEYLAALRATCVERGGASGGLEGEPSSAGPPSNSPGGSDIASGHRQRQRRRSSSNEGPSEAH